jgi:hypothetical protein
MHPGRRAAQIQDLSKFSDHYDPRSATHHFLLRRAREIDFESCRVL